MKFLCSLMLLISLAFCATSTSIGQEMELPKPGPEFDVFKADIGTWDVEIKAWGGPGEPTASKGKETNRMLGGFWLLSDFQGNMMGFDFKGHGIYSYDAEKQRYVGTWIDSLGPNRMDMIGKHDQDSNTMTFEGIGAGADGKPAKHVITTKYNDDGTRAMTMHVQAGEELMKVFEMKYTKSNAADGSGSDPALSH